MGKIVEDFLAKGLIDKEAAKRLESFESSLSKEANWQQMAKDVGMGILKGVIPATAGAILGEMAFEHFGKNKLKEDEKLQQAGMVNSFENMMNLNPHLETRRPEVYKRFMEIGSLSPTVAQAPSVAKKVIERTLDSGLDEKDMSSLLALENNSRALKVRGIPNTYMGMASKGILSSLGQGVSSALSATTMAPQMHGGQVSSNQEQPYDEQLSAEKTFKAYQALKNNNHNFPAEISNLDLTNREDKAKLIRWAMKNPEGIDDMLNDSFDSFEQAASAVRSANYGIEQPRTQEKKAQILALHYCILKNSGVDQLDKTAAPVVPIGKMGPIGKTLFGLSVASLFGLGVAAAEEAADYARTKKMNQLIGDSLEGTKRNLTQMSEEGHRLSSGIDYTDKKTMSKAVEQFKVLSDIAPNLAANPTIATSFVNTVMSQEGVISPELIKMVSDTQKNLSSIKEYKSPFAQSPFTSGISRGFGAAGGDEIIKSVAKGLAG